MAHLPIAHLPIAHLPMAHLPIAHLPIAHLPIAHCPFDHLTMTDKSEHPAPLTPGPSSATPAQRPAAPASRVPLPLVAAQVVLLLAVVGWGAVRTWQLDRLSELPPLRAEPLDVPPLYDYPVVVTDEQLVRVLRKIRPRFDGPETKIAVVDHNLRCWTADARFDSPQYSSGEAMRQLLTDHDAFQQMYGDTLPPLLIDVAGRGVRYRDFEGKGSSSHDDHTMACLAEVGTPLDFPIITPTRRTDFRAVVEQSLRDFSLNQAEYEWSALTYALLLPPSRQWYTSEGQQVSFDLLARRIMRQELPQGVCSANHRLHALVMFLRVDDILESEGQRRILSPAARKSIESYLSDATARLVAHQHPDGFWNFQWNEQTPASSEPSTVEGDRLSDRIIATGHALEWWALAPEHLHPPRSVLASAGQWMVQTIDRLSPQDVKNYASFLSHAGRALALWRGTLPDEVELELSASSS